MNTPKTLFGKRSNNPTSAAFLVRPGTAMLITAFGFQGDDYVSVLKVMTDQGTLPTGAACEVGSFIIHQPSIMVDSASVCCEWAVTVSRNMLVIAVPGVYQLAVGDEGMLGRVTVEAVQIDHAAAKLIPSNMLFGSNDCECCGEEQGAITCADLQILFSGGNPVRYMGIDAAGRCVTGTPPVFNETPLTVIDSSTIDFSNTGTMGHVVTGSVRVSNDSGNSVQIRADGLYVPFNSETPFIANDSPTIDFTTSGQLGHVLTGVVRISGDVGNLISVRGDGLFVTAPSVAAQTPLTVVDSPTVELSSSGEAGHTVTAAVKVSAGAGNKIIINQDGLYVPPLSCADLSGVFTQGTPYWVFGRTEGGNCVFGPLPQGSGPQTPLVAVDSSTIDFSTSGTDNHTLTGVVRVSGAGGNRIVINPDGLFSPPITCADFLAVFAAGTPTSVLGRDANGNCVLGPVPSGGGAVDCASIRAVFTTALPVTPTLKLLAHDGTTCGEVDACALGPRPAVMFGGPSAAVQFSLADLKAICGSGSTNPEDDPVSFFTVTSGWKGNGEMSATPGAAYWPADTSVFPVVAGRAYVITVMSVYPKFGDGPVLGNLNATFNYTGGGAGTVIDDPWSVPVQSGQLWLSAWVVRATASGNLSLRFNTTDNSAARTAYQMNWMVTEAKTASGQPVTYSEAQQAGTRYSLQSAAPNNVLQTAFIPGVTAPYDLFVYGARNVDDPTATGGPAAKGFSFANGTVLGTQYSSSLLASGGGGGGAQVIDLTALNLNNVTLSTPGGNAPSGAAIRRLSEMATSAYHYLSGIQITGAAGATVRFELEVELDPGNTHSVNQIRIGSTNGPGGPAKAATFSTADGSVQGAGANATPSVTPLTGNWVRVTVDWALGAGANPNGFSIEFASSGAGTYAGNASRYINLGRAQMTNLSAGGGGGARPANVAQAHAWSANGQMSYGVNTNDLANSTGANADDYRVAYKAFRFHAEVTPGGGGTIEQIFHQASTTVCDADPCANYMSVLSLSGAQISGAIPEDSAYRLIYRVNNAEMGRFLLDNRGGSTAKPIEELLPGFEMQVTFGGDGCATAAAEVRIECVQGNPAAAEGGLYVGAYRMIHRAYPTT